MSGSSASASADPRPRELVVGVNWLGDALMSMPALQAWRSAHPGTALDLLVKPKLTALWRLHDAPDRLLDFAPGARGPFRTGRELRALGYRRAVVMPNSIRSALAPWWAGIPERIGAASGLRNGLLTRRVDLTPTPGREHQGYEAFRLLGLPEPTSLPHPQLHLPPEAVAKAEVLREGLPAACAALVPGAARGPSKQWPEANFGELATRLQRERGLGILWLGTPGDQELCGRLAAAHGGRSLAGLTPLHVFAALLASATVVVANDSGGMHLAAALGAPTIGLFGLTDPSRTGPLGPRATVLQKSDVRSRAIDRESPAAREALDRITVNDVFTASLAMR